MPAVDCEQPATRDGDGRRDAEVGERVGGDVRDGGVGRELENHDDVLLHLILKHQRALGKETLVRQTERKREGQRGGGGQSEEGGKVGEERGGEERRGGGGGDGGTGRDRTDGSEGGGGKGEGILVGAQGQSRFTH